MTPLCCLQVLRGLSTSNSLLSCNSEGKLDLWNEVDASGRQEWQLEKLLDGNIYNITVSGGLTDPDKKYLSCDAEGNGVGLYSQDDGSGRQKWLFKPITTDPSIPAYYLISPFAGVSGTKYLSCAVDGSAVDLFDQDDKSGRQRWQLQGLTIN